MMSQDAAAWKTENLSELRANAGLLPEPRRSQQLQIITLREQDEQNGIPPSISQQRKAANRLSEPERPAAIASTDLEMKRFAAAR